MRRSRRTAQPAAAQRRPGQHGQQSARQPKTPERVFWGDPTAEAPAAPRIRPAAEPAAVIRSIGPPPLGAHEKVAEHYFVAVYDKAVNLASAVAAAGGLLDTDDDPDDPS
jgi:hypothetical protein